MVRIQCTRRYSLSGRDETRISPATNVACREPERKKVKRLLKNMKLLGKEYILCIENDLIRFGSNIATTASDMNLYAEGESGLSVRIASGDTRENSVAAGSIAYSGRNERNSSLKINIFDVTAFRKFRLSITTLDTTSGSAQAIKLGSATANDLPFSWLMDVSHRGVDQPWQAHCSPSPESVIGFTVHHIFDWNTTPLERVGDEEFDEELDGSMVTAIGETEAPLIDVLYIGFDGTPSAGFESVGSSDENDRPPPHSRGFAISRSNAVDTSTGASF